MVSISLKITYSSHVLFVSLLFFFTLTVHLRDFPMTGDIDLPHSYQYVRKLVVLMGNLGQIFVRRL